MKIMENEENSDSECDSVCECVRCFHREHNKHT